MRLNSIPAATTIIINFKALRFNNYNVEISLPKGNNKLYFPDDDEIIKVKAGYGYSFINNSLGARIPIKRIAK